MAEAQNCCILGIKKKSLLSDYMLLPECNLIDYMHACCEGSYKHILELWLDTHNHKESYYMNSKRILQNHKESERTV